MSEQNEKIEENIGSSQRTSNRVGDSKMSLEEIEKREEQYKALVDFFKKDIEIKTTLMNLAPKPIDEYSEESRMDYLARLFSELNVIEFKFKTIARKFNAGVQLENSFKDYFDRVKNELAELGYGGRHESLEKIYQKIFTAMKPELVEKAKQTFCGYTMFGGLGAVSSMMDDVGSINELLHITHSSIINDEELLKSMPLIGTKKNSFGYNITLFGKENEVSKKIFDNIPQDLDVGYTDIVSMEDRTLMMVRDRGHALTIDIDSSDIDNIDVRYFVPKICNLDMVKALPGINTSSITQNGARGFFVSKGEDISESIFSFIGSVPTDMDFPENKELTNNKNTFLFSSDDAKRLAISRKLGKIKELFAKFKEFIKSKNNVKSKGEDKENNDQSR